MAELEIFAWGSVADGRVWILAVVVAYLVLAACAVLIPRLLPEWFYRWMGETRG